MICYNHTQRVFLYTILFLLALGTTFASARYENERIHQVVIKGNRLIKSSVLLNKIKTKKNKKLRKHIVNQDVQNIFNMGWFENIYVQAVKKKNRLIVTFNVEEKPRISSILYKGNQTILDQKLSEISGLQSYEFLSIKKLKEGIRQLQDHYEEKGYFLTKINYKLKRNKKNHTVKIIFHIDEGYKTVIKKINIIGNKGISSSDIKSTLSSKEDSFFSFLTGGGIYKVENLKRDLQIIRYLYLEQGYLNVKVGEPEVTISPTKDQLYITFFIEEGQRFKLGSVDFTGDLTLSKVELRKLVSLKEGEYLSYSQLQRDLKKIQVAYGERGYAFTNVIPQMGEDRDNIHFLFKIQKGVKNRIRRINIYGNDFTRDLVIRRRLLINEGDQYDGLKVEKSKNLIKNLGYFDEVNIINETLLNDDSNIDLSIAVKEREKGLGIAKAGAGWTSNNLSVDVDVRTINLMGLGLTAGFKVKYFSFTDDFLVDLSYQDPFVNNTLWYLDANVFVSERIEESWVDFFKNLFSNKSDSTTSVERKTTSRWLGLSTTDREFNSELLGGYLTLGRWFLDSTINMQFRLGGNRVTIPYVADMVIFDVKEVEGWRSSLTTLTTYDTRDDRLFPTKGFYLNSSLEYTYHFRTGGLSNKQYTQFDLQMKHYYNVFWRAVLINTLQAGALHSISQDPIPFDKLYLIGGPYTLRGFNQFSVGKRYCSGKKPTCNPPSADASLEERENSDRYIPYGGIFKFVYNMELLFPVSAKGNDIYAALFFDAGFADDVWDYSLIRADVGIGALWISPFGPLSFKIGFPIGRKPEYLEDPYVFHFSTGYTF